VDDTQLYISFNPADNSSEAKAEAVIAIEKWNHEVRSWMRDDTLSLNDEKTEFLIIATERLLSKMSVVKIQVGQTLVTPVSSERSLSAWFDSYLHAFTHVTNACSSAFYYLGRVVQRPIKLTQD